MAHALKTAGRDIKLAHSVFALPFALLGATLARPDGEPAGRFLSKLSLIVVCMFFARSWAMLINRLADARIDAHNPRTKNRALASGQLSMTRGWGVALACAGLFVLTTTLYLVLFDNPWPIILAVPVLIWIAFYSYTKRFTWLCHVFLGGALAASPIAAAIAVDGFAWMDHSPTALTIFWLAGMVLMWVAGFDVIYALQDLSFDREAGLNSIPAAFGWRNAAWISRFLHAAAFIMLVLAWRADPRLSIWFGAGVAIVALLLIFEHAVLAKKGKAGLSMAFFTINGIVSCVLGITGIIDVLG